MSEQEIAKSNSNVDSKFPEFISSGANHIEYQEENSKHRWLDNNLQKLMIWVSLIWFAIVIIYISQFFGWSNLFLMMPDEFGAFLAGVTLPLAIIWVVIAYVDRGASFKKEAKLLRSYMNSLVYPEEGSAETAKAMAAAIRSQIIELQEVTKLATMQTEKIKNELGNRVEDFAGLVKVLDNYSSQTIGDLTDGVKTLVSSFDYVAEKAITSTEMLQNKVKEFSGSGEQIRGSVESIFEMLLPRIQELKASSAMLKNINDENNSKMIQANDMLVNFQSRVNKSLADVSETLNAQTERLETVVEKTKDNVDSFKETIKTDIRNIEETLKTHRNFTTGFVNELDKNVSGLSRKFSEQGEALGVEVEKIMTRASNVSESINTQVDNLRNVSENVIGKLNDVDMRLQNEVKNIELYSQNADGSIKNLITSFDQQNNHLDLLSNTAVKNFESVCETIEDKTNKLHNISDGALEKLAKVSGDVEQRAQSLHNISNDAITKIEEIGEVMTKHSDSLKETTTIVQTQSQISETSLVQQQKHITASAAKIEEIKSELRRQIEELVKASDLIESHAGTVVERLQIQLAKALESCNYVVDATRGLNESLTQQVNSFDAETTKSLEKANEFENILQNQIAGLAKATTSIEEKSHKVTELLGRQIGALNASADNTAKAMDISVSGFEKQNQSLQNITNNTLQHVSTMVQIMDEKAETLNQLFNHQENEFFEICDKITENTNNIGSSLKKQVSVIEQNADRVFSRMSALEENFNKHAEEILKISDKANDRLSETYNTISDEQIATKKQIQEITEKLSGVYENLQSGLTTLSTEFGKIEQQSSDSTDKLLANANKIQAVHQVLGDGARNISGLLENHTKNLENSISKVKSQADLINDTFTHQKDSLTDVVNAVSTQTRLGEASMAQQYKMLTDVSAEVAAKIADINAKFKNSTDSIFDLTTKLSYEFDVLGDKLLSVSEDVSKASKNSAKHIEQVNLSLSQSADDLGVCVNKSVAKIGEVGKEYEKYIANFNTVTAEASTGVVEINKMIGEQSNKVTSITEDTRKLVEFFNKILNDTSVDFTSRAQQAYDKVKGFGENLKSLSLQINETAKMSTVHMENSSDKLRSSISEIASNAERISNEIRSSGEVFLQQSNVLLGATDETIKKVNVAMENLNNAANAFETKGDDVLSKSGHLSELFARSMNDMQETSRKAEDKISELEKRYKRVKVEHFLKDAGYVIEKLQAMAVDMNRIFSPETEEDLWKKYYDGDTAAFVRHLSKNMNKQQVLQIKSEFEKNIEFRDLVTRYMSDFELLIAEAKKNERSGVIMAVISGSDVGKVYYILAHSLNKIG